MTGPDKLKHRNIISPESGQSPGNKLALIILPLLLYQFARSLTVLILSGLLSASDLLYMADSGLTSLLQQAVNAAGMAAGAAVCYPVFQKDRQSGQTLKKAEGAEGSFRHTLRRSAARVILAAASGAVLAIGINLIFIAAGVMERSQEFRQTASGQLAVPFAAGILFYGIVSPAAEELVYRGILYTRIKRAASVRTGVLVSAVVFGAFHGNVVQLVYGCIMGVLLAVLYERTEKLILPCAFHAGANIAVFVASTLHIFI